MRTRPLRLTVTDSAASAPCWMSASAAHTPTMRLPVPRAPKPAGAGLALLEQHVAHERAVDLFGREPQDVAGEAGGERAHEVLVLGERGGGARAGDDRVAHHRVGRERRVDHVDGRRAVRAVRAIRIGDAQRPQRLAEHVLAELDPGCQSRRELRLCPRGCGAHDRRLGYGRTARRLQLPRQLACAIRNAVGFRPSSRKYLQPCSRSP